MKLQLFRLVSLVNLPLLFVVSAYISSLLILPSGVDAQKNITPGVDPNIIRSQPKIPITTGFERRFRTDIDDGGDLDEWRAVLGVNFGTSLGKQWRLGVGINYLYNRYNFSGSSGFSGLDPWEDIHSISLSVPVMYQPTQRLRFNW